MRIVKLDDYQTWLFETEDARVLVDPWLTPTMTFPMGMFHRTHELKLEKDLDPTHVIVTAPFGDHLHAPSLALLPKQVPLFTTKGASKQVRKLGFEQVQDGRGGEKHALSPSLQVTFIAPGFPYMYNSLGFLLEESVPGGEPKRVYLETHVISDRTLATLPRPLDALITTTQNVRFFGIQLSMDVKRSARSAVALQARRLVATGVDPQRATGHLSSMLYIRGDAPSLAAAVTQTGTAIPQLWPLPGEAIQL